MRLKHMILAIAAATGLAMTPAAAQDRVSIGTGGTGGLFYVIGAGMADVLNRNLEGTTARAEVTGASVENIRRVSADQMTFGFSSSSTLYEASVGEGPFEEALPVAGMAYLYPAVLQLATIEGTGVESMEDLAGKRINLGPPGSNAAVAGPAPARGLWRVRTGQRAVPVLFRGNGSPDQRQSRRNRRARRRPDGGADRSRRTARHAAHLHRCRYRRWHARRISLLSGLRHSGRNLIPARRKP